LKAGADIELKDGISGQTPLSLAARRGRTEVVKLLEGWGRHRSEG
jgi:ankyrin repeat protein